MGTYFSYGRYCHERWLLPLCQRNPPSNDGFSLSYKGLVMWIFYDFFVIGLSTTRIIKHSWFMALRILCILEMTNLRLKPLLWLLRVEFWLTDIWNLVTEKDGKHHGSSFPILTALCCNYVLPMSWSSWCGKMREHWLYKLRHKCLTSSLMWKLTGYVSRVSSLSPGVADMRLREMHHH